MASLESLNDQPQTRTIPLIPLEIYLEIVSHIGLGKEYQHALTDMEPVTTSHRNRAIRNMALACRDFYYHMFPLLFESIFICKLSPNTDEAPAHYARFCKSIVDGDERARTLATSVKSYAIAHFNLDEAHRAPDQDLKGSLSIYSRAVGHMSNLKELYLFQTTITSDLLRATASLPPLKILRIDGCPVDLMDESTFIQFSKLRTKQLFIDDSSNVFFTGDDNQLPSHSAAVARDLFYKNMCISHTEDLRSDNGIRCHFFHALASMPTLIHLRYVTINRITLDTYPTALSDALARMPHLESFRVEDIAYNFVEEGQLVDLWIKVRQLPQLERIHAHLPALKALIPGSRVSSIGIAREHLILTPQVPYSRGPNFWMEYAIVFNKSTRPIDTMDVPMNFYKSIQFSDLFPDLRFLKICPMHCNWYYNTLPEDSILSSGPDEILLVMLTAWNNHPKLVELEFVYEHQDVIHPGIVTMMGESEDDDAIVLLDFTVDLIRLKIPTLQRLSITKVTRGNIVMSSRDIFLGREEADITSPASSDQEHGDLQAEDL